MSNIKSLSLIVQKLWSTLKVFATDAHIVAKNQTQEFHAEGIKSYLQTPSNVEKDINLVTLKISEIVDNVCKI